MVIELNTVVVPRDLVMRVEEALFFETRRFGQVGLCEVWPIIIKNIFALDSGINNSQITIMTLDTNRVQCLEEVSFPFFGYVVINSFAIIQFSEGGHKEFDLTSEIRHRRGDIGVEAKGFNNLFISTCGSALIIGGNEILITRIIRKRRLIAPSAFLNLLEIQDITPMERDDVLVSVFEVKRRDLIRLCAESVLKIGPIDGVVRGLT
jgi:hypothetical protein